MTHFRGNPLARKNFFSLLLCLASLYTLSGFQFTSKAAQLSSSRLQERKAPANNDFISQFFGAILPTPEDIGLTRYNRTSRPENYYCTTTEWADPVESDKVDPDMSLVRQTLKYTNLETRELRLGFSAERDGWNAKEFHKRVDKQGPAIVLCRTISGGVIGGYNPTGWAGYGELRGSVAAFLFTFPGGDLKSRPIKLPKISGAGRLDINYLERNILFCIILNISIGLAQVDDGGGPRFGAEGLTVALERSNPKLVRSKLGLYYDRLPDGGKSLLPKGALSDELCDVKVFLGVYNPGEKIPYSDAMPFSLN